MQSADEAVSKAALSELLVWIWILIGIVCIGFHFVLAGGFFVGMAAARTIKSIYEARCKRRQQDRP